MSTVAVNDVLETITGTYEPSDELVNSIQRYGVLLPILINMNDEIVDGRRRLLAAHKLGIEEIPAKTIYSEDDLEEAAIGVAVHATRSRNFITEYEACKILRDAGHNTSEIAKLTGLTHQQVNGLWRFDNIIPEVWEAVKDGRISGNHIRQGLVKLSREQQLEVLAAEKITWKLLKEIRQADVKEAWDGLDLPDVEDGGTIAPRDLDPATYDPTYGKTIPVQKINDMLTLFRMRTGAENRPTSWKMVCDTIEGYLLDERN